MIKSMTGYGKSEASLPGGKLTVEVRTLNAKGCEVNLKSSLLPKDKDLQVRQMIADALQRGTIDVFLSWEADGAEGAKPIDAGLVEGYLGQLRRLMAADAGLPEPSVKDPETTALLLSAVLRLPDVIDTKKQEIITEENWPLVEQAFRDCLAQVNQYRADEGAVLYKDVTTRVASILALSREIEGYEAERIEAVRARLLKALEDLAQKPDKERFEQELVFYLEKLDINEERVRLRQHCQYFMDTIDTDPYPGKKLGFIIQEMGREINTTGSKANHALIQKSVVKMKDELEKIREQSLNIL